MQHIHIAIATGIENMGPGLMADGYHLPGKRRGMMF
jgi:hypothetical protein